jgi:HEAT repeats
MPKPTMYEQTLLGRRYRMKGKSFALGRKSVAIAAMVVVISSALFCETNASTSVNWRIAEKNYIADLSSNNTGIRLSAANHIGEYKLDGAVGPLMAMLKTDTHEQVRMAAALALIRLNDERGRKAVEEASLYDGSDKVAQFCRSLLIVTAADNTAAR